jgi:hypothetical protein
MVLWNLHISALTLMIQLASNSRVSQHTNLSLPDWLSVPGEPDLEVMRLTEDAIPPRPCRVGRTRPPGGSDDGNDGDQEEK